MSDAREERGQREGRETDEYAPKIPVQVRRRAREAERLHKELLGQEGGEQGDGQEGGEAPPPPVSEPGAAPPLPPQETPPPPQELSDWEQRYRSLQGKYDNEMPQMRARVQSLEQLISTMRTAPPPVNLPSPDSVPERRQIPDEDVNAYGPEIIEASRRWTRAEMQGEIDMLRSKINSLESGQQRQQVQAQTNTLENTLDRDPEIGNGVWQRMNHDAAFIQWLQEIDPFSGVTRYVMLNHAYSNGDAERTSRFFKAYIREHTDGSRPSSVPPQTYNGGYSSGAGQQPTLEDYAAPGRAPRATPGGGAPERRIWTNRDITAFYEDRMRGKFRGREDEAERLERDIFDAASEGRVQNA